MPKSPDIGTNPPNVAVCADLAITAWTRRAHTSMQIAELLVISVKTVERHRANILDKLVMRDASS